MIKFNRKSSVWIVIQIKTEMDRFVAGDVMSHHQNIHTNITLKLSCE